MTTTTLRAIETIRQLRDDNGDGVARANRSDLYETADLSAAMAYAKGL